MGEAAQKLEHGETIRFALRKYAGAADDPVIYSAWCNQIRKVAPFCAWGPDRFRGYKHGILEPIVARCGATIACNPDHHQQVYGWAVGELTDDKIPILHMVYVREPHRGRQLGPTLARTALPALGLRTVFYTHQTRSTPYWERVWRLTYAPQFIHMWTPVTKEEIQ